jgi:hypothetical protein
MVRWLPLYQLSDLDGRSVAKPVDCCLQGTRFSEPRADINGGRPCWSWLMIVQAGTRLPVDE